MAQYLISIVIPARNERENISRLIGSIKANDFSDYEIVVVDGGSTDGTAEFAEENGARVVEGPQKGPSVARDEGWRKADGEYIYFLDADFYLESGALDKISRHIEENPEIESVGTDVHYDTQSSWVSECVKIENKSANLLNELWGVFVNAIEEIFT